MVCRKALTPDKSKADLKSEEKHEVYAEVNPEEELASYNSIFTYLLFNSVCKSILEKDKLLFTLSLMLNIFVTNELNTVEEVRFLASGSTSKITEFPDNPISDWLSDKVWYKIYEDRKSVV